MLQAVVSRAMAVSHRLAMLPAFASLDWCDRAAAAIGGALPGGQSCVSVLSVESGGRIVGREATGASAGEGEEARARALELRSWCERTTHVCCVLEGAVPSGGIRGRVERLRGGESWRDPALASVWGGTDPGRVLALLHPIGAGVEGRLIVALVGSSGATDAELDAGEEILSVAGPMLAERAMTALGSERSTRQRWISPREQEVLQRLILGMSIREIADDLGRSPHTVHDHVKTLHRKLNASSRGELISRALGTSGRVEHPMADLEPKPAVPGVGSRRAMPA